MGIRVHDYGRFIEIINDPDGSGQYAEGSEIEVPQGTEIDELLLSLGYEIAGEWEEFEWFGENKKAVDLIQL